MAVEIPCVFSLGNLTRQRSTKVRLPGSFLNPLNPYTNTNIETHLQLLVNCCFFPWTRLSNRLLLWYRNKQISSKEICHGSK